MIHDTSHYAFPDTSSQILDCGIRILDFASFILGIPGNLEQCRHFLLTFGLLTSEFLV
jgi:hypothetical protein